MLTCNICNNTRHTKKKINGKITILRCSCQTRLRITEALKSLDVDPSLINKFWSENLDFSLPEGLNKVQEKHFNYLDLISQKIKEGLLLKKLPVIFNTESRASYSVLDNNYCLTLLAYLISKVSLNGNKVSLNHITDLTEDFFAQNTSSKINLKDLNVLFIGNEASKKMTEQILKDLYQKSILKGKNLLIVSSIPIVTLPKTYPSLSDIFEESKILKFIKE